MTMTDLEEYTANVESPLSISLANGETDLLVPQLPSGGPILQFVLRVMEGQLCNHLNVYQSCTGNTN
jgi:gamma-glutamyltranspeptidase